MKQTNIVINENLNGMRPDYRGLIHESYAAAVARGVQVRRIPHKDKPEETRFARPAWDMTIDDYPVFYGPGR